MSDTVLCGARPSGWQDLHTLLISASHLFMCTHCLQQEAKADICAGAGLDGVSQKGWTSSAQSAQKKQLCEDFIHFLPCFVLDLWDAKASAEGAERQISGLSFMVVGWSRMENEEPNAALPLSIKMLSSEVNVEEQAQNETNLNSVMETSNLAQIEFRIQQLQGRHLLLQKTLSCTKKEERVGEGSSSSAERKSPLQVTVSLIITA